MPATDPTGSDRPGRRRKPRSSQPSESVLTQGAVGRSMQLLRLPLGHAGRRTSALGRRLRGDDGAVVDAEMRARAADQLFTVLGELKGGAMKFGQALSLFEAVLPDDIAGPYRQRLRQLQDAAPPMPASRVHAVLGRELGRDWRDLFERFDPRPVAAASIGQVHRAVWKADGRPVAVKVQYPGADTALRADLAQIGRMAAVVAPLAGGIDVRPLAAELVSRVSEEVDYDLEAANQQLAADRFADHPEFVVPSVVAHTTRVLVSDWIDGVSLASLAEADETTRNAAALRYVRFLFAGPAIGGLLHADPHPGNFRVLPDGRLGVVDFGLVERMPDGLPVDMGRLLRACVDEDAEGVTRGLTSLGFISRELAPEDVMDYLSPFVEPATAAEFHFTRDWMRGEFARITTPEAQRVARRLNLPPEYLIIHRVWLGGIAVISQLDSRAPFGSVLEEFLPGFARR